MSKIAAGTLAATLVLGGGAAVAATQHPAPGCKVVSTHQTAPAYATPTDRTGTYTVITVSKCHGKTVTTYDTRSTTR